MPAHVVEHLIAIGRLDEDGIGRKARITRCPRCAALICVGLDHDRVASTARVDLAPLSPAGELQALLANRATYELSRQGRYLIDRRRADHIRVHPAGSLRAADVVAEHRCAAGSLPGVASRIAPLHRFEAAECPF